MLAQKKIYNINIRGMRLRLLQMLEDDLETKGFKKNLPEYWDDMKTVLYFHIFLYVSDITHSTIINCHYNDILLNFFQIEKTRKLLNKKYFCPIIY